MRDSLKNFAFWIATIGVLPMLLSFRLRQRVLGEDRALMASSQFISLAPGLLGQYLRRAFFHRTLESCHRSACIEFGTVFSKQGTSVGKNVYIGPGCHIGLADIGDEVLIASNVHIPSGPKTHTFDDPVTPIRNQSGSLRKIKIGSGVWVGESAIILADVGRGSIVAAGAVVVKDLPEGVVAGGIPARILKSRFHEDPGEVDT